MMMMKLPVEVEEAAEEVAVAVIKLKVEEGKMPNKPSKRPRKTSPLYELTEP